MLTLGNDRTMQTCFREHPDIYGSELEADEEENAPPDQETPTPYPAPLADPTDESIPAAATSATLEPHSSPMPSAAPAASEAGTTDTERARAAKQQVEGEHGEPMSESDELVPKAAHDATGAVGGK